MGRARTHPGVLLRAELDARGMSAQRLPQVSHDDRLAGATRLRCPGR